MSKITAAIVDDEPFARERVRRLLADDERVEVVGEAGDGAAAVELIREKTPDLVFLDVQMPGRDGFDVLADVADAETMPLVIFLTAYDRYAVRAFEAAALDYLLKPFDEERFQKAVERAVVQFEQRRADAPAESETSEIFRSEDGFLERILVKKGGRVFFFKTDEIEWIEAYGNYVRLHLENQTHLLRETLSGLEAQLDPKKFARIHRSGLVNLERVREFRPVFGGRGVIVLASGTEIDISRRYNRRLAKLFERA